MVKILQHLSQMWLIANLFILSAYFEILALPEFIYSQSLAAHHWCRSMVISTTELSSINQALICAAPLQDTALKQLTRAAGIVHYFVVSGAHILILEKLYSQLPLPKKIRELSFLVLLSFYCAVCNFSAPILRSFLYFIIRNLSARWQLQWSGLDCLIVAFSITLALRPELWTSLSLQLSCTASALLLLNTSSLKQSALIYLGICFYISGFGAPHPISILINLAFAPLFAMILLPLTWLSAFIPPLTELNEILWQWTLFLIHKIDLEVLPNYQISTHFTGWVFLLALFLTLLYRNIYLGQKRCLHN